MIVVADSSPLNYLIRLGHIDILRDFYGRVLVPCGVSIELQHAEAPAVVRTWIAAAPEWLEITVVQNIDETLGAELGIGEREAISLALEVGADVLLIDERLGRHAAETRHIPVAGTLAVLMEASLRGRFDFLEVLGRLRQYGFRVSPSVKADIIARYKAARRKAP